VTKNPSRASRLFIRRIDANGSVLTSFLNRLMRPCTKCMRIA